MTKKQGLSRRDFLRLTGGTVAAVTLAGLPEVAAAKPHLQEVKIIFWSPNCDVECEQKDTPDWLKRYTNEVNPNVTFDLSGPPWGDYWTRLPLAIAGGSGPDMYFGHNAYMLQFIGGGLVAAWPEERVAQLRELIDGTDEQLIDGKLYSFDEGYESNLIYYGKKAWEEAGLTEADIPTTWDALIELAHKLTIKDKSGAITRAGFDGNLKDGRWTWVALKYQLGEFLFTEDGRRINAFTEGGRKAAQMMWDWERGDDPVGNIDLAPWVEDALPTEVTVVGFGFGWMADYWRTTYPDYQWGAFPLPALEGAPALTRRTGWATLGVNPQVPEDRQQIAFDVIQWHGTDPASMKYRALGGEVPTLRSIKDDPEILASPVVKAMQSVMDRAVFCGIEPSGWEQGLAQLTELLFVARTGTIDEALSEVQQQVDDVLKKYDKVYWGAQERAYAHADEMHDPEILG
jgi:multiple sugar transport system substrate-binding protein